MTDDKLNMSLSANTIMAKLTNQFQRTRDHRLTNTIHLTLKMTSTQVVKTSVTNNSSFQNYLHPGRSQYTNYLSMILCQLFHM